MPRRYRASFFRRQRLFLDVYFTLGTTPAKNAVNNTVQITIQPPANVANGTKWDALNPQIQAVLADIAYNQGGGGLHTLFGIAGAVTAISTNNVSALNIALANFYISTATAHYRRLAEARYLNTGPFAVKFSATGPFKNDTGLSALDFTGKIPNNGPQGHYILFPLANGDTLSILGAAGGAKHGTLVLANNVITYTPTPGYIQTGTNGMPLASWTDTFIYIETDSAGDSGVGEVSLTITAAAQPQLLAGNPTPSVEDISDLTNTQLAPIVTAAIAQWTAAGISTEELKALQSATYNVGILPAGEVGSTTGNVVTISPDAAGAGWFVDPTPADNVEFSQIVAPTEFDATPGSPAYGEVDLLTTVSHEMGHILGLPDVANAAEPDDLMDISIATGVRRIPQASDLQALQSAAPVAQAPANSSDSTVPDSGTVATIANSTGSVTSPTYSYGDPSDPTPVSSQPVSASVPSTVTPITLGQPLLLAPPSAPPGPAHRWRVRPGRR